MPSGAPPATAWRSTEPWNKEYLDKLKRDVRSITAPAVSKIQQLNILLLGHVGAGKSSYFNTITSTFQERLSLQARCGSAEKSITSTLRMYKVWDTDSKLLPFRLCDSRGLEENIDNRDEFELILDGYLSDGFKHGSITVRRSFLSRVFGSMVDYIYKFLYKYKEHPSYRQQPSLSDKMHCVCFILDGSTVPVLEGPSLQKLRRLKAICVDKDIPFVIILTKSDKVCPNVSKDVSQIFHSQGIKEAVEKTAELFGVAENFVHPVKNYDTEIDTSINIGILSLLSLKFMLSRAKDILLNKFDYNHSNDNLPADAEFVINMPS